MNNDFAEIDLSPEERLYHVLARVEDRLSRLDERARGCGFSAGWRRRADVRSVIAQLWSEGELVHPEDLLLHDIGADTRFADPALLRAAALLRARRKAWNGGAELLSWRGVAWLTARVSAPPPSGMRPSLRVGQGSSIPGLADVAAFLERVSQGQTDSPRAAVEEGLEVLDVAIGAPAALRAAALCEVWRAIDPLPALRGLGGLLAAQSLRVDGRFGAGLFPLEVALRRRPMPSRLAWASPIDRLRFWLESFERSATLELEELDRLKIQKVLIDRKAAGGRSNSKIPALATLAVERSVLTTDLVARELRVSPQGAGQLIKRLEGALQEITGRASYRVWRL